MSGHTVVILGAGASYTYGLPLGKGLVDRIRDLLPNSATTELNGVSKTLYAQICEDAHLLKAWQSQSHRDPIYALFEFRARLVHSDPRSIDEFLSRDFQLVTPVFRQIGKLAIAHVIATSEVASIFEQLERSDDPMKDHWYRYLWKDCLNDRCRTLDDLKAKKLRFVSFNYDRSLEYFLASRIAATYLTPPGDALADSRHQAWRTTGLQEINQIFQITHPYGTLGSLLAVPYGNPNNPQNHGKHMAREIRVINEERVDEEDGFSDAKKWVAEASRVVFLGFSYDPTNMQRLGLATGLPRRRASNSGIHHCELFPLTYGLERAERETLRKFYFVEHFPPATAHPMTWNPRNDEYALSEVHQNMSITQYLR
ncbi:MAG: hypothetical protein OEY75_10385, partial [Hylemonella sp.]|nr:hypothetical protein [Hylemonella sp.]